MRRKNLREKIREYHQKKTIENLIVIITKKGKCVVLRPTGFGKTYIATDFIRKYYKNKKVAYIYPTEYIRNDVTSTYIEMIKSENSDVERVIDEDGFIDRDTEALKESIKEIPNCDMITYAKLAIMTEEEIKEFINKKYDLIIFDECHRMCASKTRVTIEKILSESKSPYIGLTATPIRMDGLDVVAEFFNNNLVYNYSYIDGVNDGIFLMPKYYYCDYGDNYDDIIKAYETESALVVEKECEGMDDDKKMILNGRLLEIAKNINRQPIQDAIRQHCLENIDTNYMKFIVFFKTISKMDDNLPIIEEMFKKAFPNHNVSSVRVSSKNADDREIEKKIDSLKPADNTIHIIGAINMMTLGCHLDNISGIIMWRTTHSSTIFGQQFGRVISVNSNKQTIVFDIVDNLHRKFIFDLNRPKDSKRSYTSKEKDMQLTDFQLNENKEVVIIDDDGNQIRTRYFLNGEGNIVDENGDRTYYIYNDKNNCIYEENNEIKRKIHEDYSYDNLDILVDPVVNESTDKELMAKIEGEILAFKCHWILETHLRSWCFNNGYPYPLTKQETGKFYGKIRKEFFDWFADCIKNHNLDYPYYDIEKLLYIGTEKGDNQTSFEICSKFKNISVPRVLEVLGFTD